MVVVYNTKTPDMDVVETLTSSAVKQAEENGLTPNSEPDIDATEIGHFEYTGKTLYASPEVKVPAPEKKPDGPSYN